MSLQKIDDLLTDYSRDPCPYIEKLLDEAKEEAEKTKISDYILAKKVQLFHNKRCAQHIIDLVINYASAEVRNKYLDYLNNQDAHYDKSEPDKLIVDDRKICSEIETYARKYDLELIWRIIVKPVKKGIVNPEMGFATRKVNAMLASGNPTILDVLWFFSCTNTLNLLGQLAVKECNYIDYFLLPINVSIVEVNTGKPLSHRIEYIFINLDFYLKYYFSDWFISREPIFKDVLVELFNCVKLDYICEDGGNPSFATSFYRILWVMERKDINYVDKFLKLYAKSKITGSKTLRLLVVYYFKRIINEKEAGGKYDELLKILGNLKELFKGLCEYKSPVHAKHVLTHLNTCYGPASANGFLADLREKLTSSPRRPASNSAKSKIIVTIDEIQGLLTECLNKK